MGKLGGGLVATTAMMIACTGVIGWAPAQATPVTPAQSAHWAKFATPMANQLHLSGVHTVTIHGAADSAGTCSFQETGAVPAGGSPVFTEQLAVDSSQCVEQVLEGTPTQGDLAYLNSLDTSGGSGAPSKATATSTRLSPAKTLIAAATTSSTAYEKTAYKDPVNITITSLSANLTWAHNGSSVPNASYRIVPYEFQYDGWSNSGTPHPGFTFTSSSVSIQANESFKNTDFEQLLLAAGLLTCGPACLAAVYAACGFSVAPAVFTHREYIKGNASGGYNWSFNDSATGGCSSLINNGYLYAGHYHYTAFGSSN
ncbi:MAG: hypothetical protein M3Y42_17625 [Actinomycetota bacterium]|nr:hypothetical protein [Actinomycetota bacterium]MDQ2958764.1 hypothetical protein [Actinomycetota bacterium]